MIEAGQQRTITLASQVLSEIASDIRRHELTLVRSRLEGGAPVPPDDVAVTNAQFHKRVADVVDALVFVFRLTPKYAIHDRAGRSIAIDLAIPQELQRAFTFIGGRDDGTLFVLSPRASTLQLFVDSDSGEATYLMTSRVPVHANRLVRLELKEAV